MRKITIFLMTVIMLFGIVPSAAANENKEFELPVEGATGYADLTLLASEWWHFNDLETAIGLQVMPVRETSAPKKCLVSHRNARHSQER